MTQEDKELLLKDLCARLPYGVKMNHIADEEICPLTLVGVAKDMITLHGGGGYACTCVEDYTPYLFPLSSMTEEQKKEQEAHFTCIKHDMSFSICRYIEWCYKNHFDINGLIEKELALDATGLNIY